MYEDAVIAGYGETEYHKRPADQDHPLEYLRDAITEALDDSGVETDEVDGLAVTSFDLPRDGVASVAHHLGISGSWFLDQELGSASPISGLVRGANAIEEGRLETVVVAASGATSPDGTMAIVDDFNSSVYNYMRPYGFGGANGLFALLQRRHMHEYGTTREQLAEIATLQRENARLNPKALLRDPMDVDDYLNARPIVEPLHLFDCVLPCGGGTACVLTTRERAEQSDADVVNIWGGEEFHNPNPLDAFNPSGGWKRHDIVEKAGIDHEDVDTLQLYDNYPINAVMQIEDLGFCEKGDGGRFVAETDLSIDGELALNTDGGHLSVGQAGGAGGLLGLVEGVRQLRGEAGERQVPDCRVALASGFGNVAYGGGLSSSAVLFSADRSPEGVA